MSDATVYTGDVGTKVIVSTGAPNLSSAQALRIYWEKPDRTTAYVTAVVESEAAGTISWAGATAYWADQPGVWHGQAFVQYSSTKVFWGDRFSLDVREVIEVGE